MYAARGEQLRLCRPSASVSHASPRRTCSPSSNGRRAGFPPPPLPSCSLCVFLPICLSVSVCLRPAAAAARRGHLTARRAAHVARRSPALGWSSAVSSSETVPKRPAARAAPAIALSLASPSSCSWIERSPHRPPSAGAGAWWRVAAEQLLSGSRKHSSEASAHLERLSPTYARPHSARTGGGGEGGTATLSTPHTPPTAARALSPAP